MSTSFVSSPYVLATGAAAVRRLHVLHDVYSPAGRRVLLQAGLNPGMNVADFGCGVGVVSKMLAEMVGPLGHVTGIDINGGQLIEARELCRKAGFGNTQFVQASAYETGLPRNSFDLVYCRFLLLHLARPEECLREMLDVLKPGGILVVEDGDLTTAATVPPSSMNAFSDLFPKLGSARGLNYSVSEDLFSMVTAAGFEAVNIEISQPGITTGENRNFLSWSVAEAGPAMIEEGIISRTALDRTLTEMQEVVENPSILILPPRMSLVWARKPEGRDHR